MNFIHDITRSFYSQSYGKPCIDTAILFKLIILNFIYGNNSIRKTYEEAKVNLAYKWYLGIGISDSVPNYSTFSQNYNRKFKDSEVFDTIFTKILEKLYENKLIDNKIIFVDGTHIKANANKHKRIKKQIKVVSDRYHKQLEDEVNEFREMNGRNSYPDNDDNDIDGVRYEIDDKTGEVKEKTIEKTESITDPESGMFVKGEHERQFAYVDQVACDRHRFILGFDVNPGNVHDSKAFMPFFENELQKLNPEVICADAGYASGFITKNILENNTKFIVPYVRPKGRDSEFGKNKFDYCFEIDQYICPNRKLLIPWNIRKDGNIEYKISKDECKDCSFKEKCIKNNSFKTITRHIYSDCLLKAKDIRLSKEGKEIYALRKQTIERVFAEVKERHGLRYTRFKGLKKNYNIRSLLYVCLNIKKYALYLRMIKNMNKINQA